MEMRIEVELDVSVYCDECMSWVPLFRRKKLDTIYHGKCNSCSKKFSVQVAQRR